MAPSYVDSKLNFDVDSFANDLADIGKVEKKLIILQWSVDLGLLKGSVRSKEI